jgi:hypothetical protein
LINWSSALAGALLLQPTVSSKSEIRAVIAFPFFIVFLSFDYFAFSTIGLLSRLIHFLISLVVFFRIVYFIVK